MVFIYVLALKENKYYVGQTKSVYKRIESHFEGKGSLFTTKYAPEELISVVGNCDNYQELKYVLQYMNKYGIENVRGANFCRPELTDSEKEQLKRIINGINNKCYNCGKDHFVKDCPDCPDYPDYPENFTDSNFTDSLDVSDEIDGELLQNWYEAKLQKQKYENICNAYRDKMKSFMTSKGKNTFTSNGYRVVRKEEIRERIGKNDMPPELWDNYKQEKEVTYMYLEKI